MTARRLHRLLAFAIGLFILLHLANHLAGLAGQDAHHRVQAALRLIYRAPGVEIALLGALAVQVALGLRLALRRRRWDVQTIAGSYLAVFLTIHLSAVMVARGNGVDTDLAFAAAAFHAPGLWGLFFAPYYGLAVMAVAAHLAVPLGRRNPALRRAILWAGAGVSLAILALLAGYVTPLAIPPALLVPFGA